MITLANGLIDITDYERDILRAKMIQFRRQYDSAYLERQKIRRRPRKLLEKDLCDEERVRGFYDHIMFQLSYNNMSVFIKDCDYFKLTIEGFR